MRILSIFVISTALAVALPTRPPPAVMTGTVDITIESLGLLGEFLTELSLDIWNIVSNIKDKRERKRIIEAAFEEARNQVKESDKAEDFLNARKRIEEQTWRVAKEALKQEKASEIAKDFSEARNRIEEQTWGEAEEEAQRQAEEEESKREHEEQVQREKEAEKKSKAKVPSCWKLPSGWDLRGGWNLEGDWKLEGGWDVKGGWKLPPCEN